MSAFRKAPRKLTLAQALTAYIEDGFDTTTGVEEYLTTDHATHTRHGWDRVAMTSRRVVTRLVSETPVYRVFWADAHDDNDPEGFLCATLADAKATVRRWSRDRRHDTWYRIVHPDGRMDEYFVPRLGHWHDLEKGWAYLNPIPDWWAVWQQADREQAAHDAAGRVYLASL